MKANSMHATRATFLTLALMAGCGDEPKPAAPLAGIPQEPTPVEQPALCDTPPEGVMSSLPLGLFNGTSVDQANENFILVTRDLWGLGDVEGRLFHGIDTAGSPKVAGIVWFQAGLICGYRDKRAFNGSQIFAAPGSALPGALYVHFTLGSSGTAVTGSVRELEGAKTTWRLEGGPIPGSTFDASARPILDDILGAWDLVDPLGTPGAITIANGGKLAGTIGQCAVDGAVEPSRDGSNLFEVRFKRAKECVRGGMEDFVGYIVAIPLTAGGVRILFWAEATNFFDWDFMLAAGERRVQ